MKPNKTKTKSIQHKMTKFSLVQEGEIIFVT